MPTTNNYYLKAMIKDRLKEIMFDQKDVFNNRKHLIHRDIICVIRIFQLNLIKKITAMHSVKLKIDDKIYDNLLRLLSKFNKDELEIVIEDSNWVEQKQYLKAELKEVIEGNATFYSMNEVEQRLEKIIKKHENNL